MLGGLTKGLVIGAYTKGKLTQYGYAASGFSEKGLKDAVERMKPLFIDKCNGQGAT
jgi:hypothetical protein